MTGALVEEYKLKDRGNTNRKTKQAWVPAGERILVNVLLYPIIPHVLAQGVRLGRPHVTTLKADGAWPAASSAAAAKPFTFPHLGALSPNEYHLSPLTCSMQTPVLFFCGPGPFPQLVNS